MMEHGSGIKMVARPFADQSACRGCRRVSPFDYTERLQHLAMERVTEGRATHKLSTRNQSPWCASPR